MSITYYSYPRDKDKQLSPHFKMGEFVSDSDYTDGNYPSSVPIHDMLPNILEKVYAHFGATCGIICSGYRTPDCDREVGGSGSGPHTVGIAVDIYFYKNDTPIPSRLVSCYLQDIGIKGIGYKCGGNPNGTHFDMRGYGVWEGLVWFGDETDYSSGYNDFYAYTGTSRDEVYPDGDNANPPAPKQSGKKSAMSVSTDIVDFIKSEEGLSLRAIKLSGEDYYTIGYGHYGSDVTANQTITEIEAEKLFRSDLKVFEEAVNHAVLVEITQNQFDALVSLAYNIGTGAIAESDTMQHLNNGHLGHACVDIASWRRGMGYQILAGLESRRQIETALFGEGCDFTLTDNMNIRSGAGTNAPVRKVSQITANGKKCVVDSSPTANAVFKEGTEITALEIKAVFSPERVDVWFRCPSGWICARMGDEVFVD